ncbi:MAG: endonuclease/exonuclease/phosphatase family protein [Muribaculaceae bacterium]|nr:endonuclease/exonuclease/phosphatase family protein [Muribaculaceae bacterium]
MAKSTYDYNRRRRKKRPNRVFEIITAVLALILICCAYAGHIDPQHFFLAPFMSLAFMPLLVLLLLIVVIALLLRRWIAVFTVVLAMLMTLPIITTFIPMNTAENAPPMPADPHETLKVMTFNALAFNYNDVRHGEKPSESMRMVLNSGADVVLLQEGCTDVNWEEMPTVVPFLSEIKKKYPYCAEGDEGLCIMSKFPFTTIALGEPQETHSPLGYNRKLISHLARVYDLQLPSGKQLRLVNFRLQSYHLSFGKSLNVRVSPDVKPSALERMKRSFALRGDNARQLRECIDDSPKNVIVCGDMNDIPASHVYRVIRGEDLNDSWCDVGRGYAYTYNGHGLCYRIDHILYRGDLKALTATRLTGGSSDHYPIMVTFDIGINEKNNQQSSNTNN